MKKLSFLLFAIFIALLQFSSLYARESISDTSPTATLTPEDLTSVITMPSMTPPESTGSDPVCEIDEASIPEIQFYAGSCLTRSDEGTDIDLNLHCIFSAPVYRSYCRETATVCEGSIVDEAGREIPLCTTVSESAAVCITRNHCAVPTSTPYMRETPASGTVSSISPTTVQEGSAAFILTVMGTNFTSESRVLWNGRSKTTSYVSATELHAQIDVTDIAHASTIPVSVITGAVVTGTINFTMSARPAELHTETPPPPPHAGGTATTAIGTEHAADTDTSTTDVTVNNGGGCSFNALSSCSLSFSLGWVLISFVIGSFLMMKKYKKH